MRGQQRAAGVDERPPLVGCDVVEAEELQILARKAGIVGERLALREALAQFGEDERLRQRVGDPVPIIDRPELIHHEDALVTRHRRRTRRDAVGRALRVFVVLGAKRARIRERVDILDAALLGQLADTLVVARRKRGEREVAGPQYCVHSVRHQSREAEAVEREEQPRQPVEAGQPLEGVEPSLIVVEHEAVEGDEDVGQGVHGVRRPRIGARRALLLDLDCRAVVVRRARRESLLAVVSYTSRCFAVTPTDNTVAGGSSVRFARSPRHIGSRPAQLWSTMANGVGVAARSTSDERLIDNLASKRRSRSRGARRT